MVLVDEQREPEGDPEPAARVDRAALQAARRRAALPPVDKDEPSTACRAPGNMLVIDASGALRACDYATSALAPSDASLGAWHNGGFLELRRSLAADELPRPHCRGCAQWCTDDLYLTSPPLRDYGALPAADQPAGPRTIVVRLPSDGSKPRPDLIEELAPLLPGLEALVLEGTDPLASAAAAELLAALCTAPAVPAITVRTGPIASAEAATALLAGLPVAHLELRLPTADEAALVAAKSVAARADAALRVDFLLTPATWFEFEDVALLCQAHEVGAELRVLDHDGAVPLAALSTADLALVKDAVVDRWSRFVGLQQLASVAASAFSELCQELRLLLARNLQSAERGLEGTHRAALILPPITHPWCSDPTRSSPWRTRLFGSGQSATVRDWLVHAGDETSLRDHAWLRALAHRVAYGQQQPELLQVMRRLYDAPKAHRALAEQDRVFAESFDLTRFGGPWSERLGLQRRQRRARPFEVGDAVPAVDAAHADLTVLIPSYRHQGFIAETIRSVLAQSHANYRLLVADDCSPDETVTRAEAISDPRLEVRVNAENVGLGNSVLQALASIETPYIALLNSDDLLHPDHLRTCRDALESDRSIQLVATDVQPIDGNGGMLTPANVSLVLDGKQVFDWVHWFQRSQPPQDPAIDDPFGELLERNYLVTSSNIVARTEWLRRQAESLRSLKYCLDWRLFLQAASEGALLHIRRPLIAYRLHASNTVWFQDQRRYSYYLEVNRVAAEALQRFAATADQAVARRIERVLTAVAGHLTRNPEADGFALFLNGTLDPVQLDRAAEQSPQAQAMVQQLSTITDRHRLGAAPAPAAARELDRLRLQVATARDIANAERGQRRWLQLFTDEQSGRLEEAGRISRELWERTKELDESRRALAGQLDTTRRERDELHGQRQDFARRLGEAEQQLRTRAEELQDLQARAGNLQSRLELAGREQERLTGELERSRAATDRTQQRLAATQSDLQTARGLANEQRARIAQLAHRQQELEQQLRGREFRTGDFIWNKLPLGYLAGRVKKWSRRLLDLKTRLAMRLARGKRAPGTTLDGAVVTSTRIWPIYSHTFVYQEMVGLLDMGLDVRLFHWDRGDMGQLHHAFELLRSRRVQLQHHWGNHERDQRHFERTRPDRLRSFLERISALSGKSVPQLMREPIVLQGCTFARLVELSGARYLHSYFFYDQSFMAMMAAWLLDLPRGVSCYADHMLDDYPWKFVPLHIELADVVVATSARIKRELSQLSGGKHDDKILVKPNGVDGNRFPAVERPPRASGTPFEVLSVSRLEPKKGLTHLVEAIAALAERGHKVIAHVVGSADAHSSGSLEYAGWLRQRIERLGMQQQIVMHGMLRQEQMGPVIARCRAFVAPYVETEGGDKDGIPTAMLEAMASSLPVVTTDSGSILEVIEPGVEGLVVAQRDSIAFADALQRLLTDPTLEQRMARAARARFEKDFDIHVTERALHERIRTVLAAKA